MSIGNIISPTSIAILGASGGKGIVGNAVMSNIVSGGYIGKLYPVNPSSDTILDLKCYKSIIDIEDQVELAIIITPSKVVPQVMEECGKKGMKTAGFKEIREQGKILEDKVKQLLKIMELDS
jgi:acyl-CoA synthetase (NDP forming)